MITIVFDHPVERGVIVTPLARPAKNACVFLIIFNNVTYHIVIRVIM